MKTKTTIILLVIAIVLGVYIFFIERKLPTIDELENTKKKVFALKSEDISRIEITIPNASQMTIGTVSPTIPTRTTIVCIKVSDNQWEMIEPLKTKADQAVFDNMTNQLTNLEKKDTLKENINLASFGLADPQIIVSFRAKDKTYTVKVGNKAPMDLGVYLSLEGQKEVYVVPVYFYEMINKPISDFRHKKIFDANSYDITNLKFIYHDSDKPIELQKKNEEWFLTQPVSEKAEQTKILDILTAMSTLSVATFVADNENNLQKYGLDNPLLKLMFTAPKSETLLLGKESEKEKGKFLGIKEGTQTVFTIDKSSYDQLMIIFDDLRDKKFFSALGGSASGGELTTAQISQMEIKYNQKQVFQLGKNNDKKWGFIYPTSTAHAPYDVDSFIDKLNDSLIEQFIADTTTDLPDRQAGLTPYGLSEPFTGIEIIISFADTSTPPSRILVGSGKSPKYVYLKKADSDRVVAMNFSLWEYLKQGSILFRKKSIFDIPFDKVTKLSISVGEKGTSTYEQLPHQEWKMVSPKDEPIGKSDSLTNLMLEFCHLTASEFVADINFSPASPSGGPDLSNYGLDKPEAVVTLEFGDKDKEPTIKNLHIGKKIDNHYYARLGDDVIIFKIATGLVENIYKVVEPSQK